MKIEAGKKYKTEQGFIIEIKDVPLFLQMFSPTLLFLDSLGYFYNSDGTMTVAPENELRDNIVSEYVETKQELPIKTALFC